MGLSGTKTSEAPQNSKKQKQPSKAANSLQTRGRGWKRRESWPQESHLGEAKKEERVFKSVMSSLKKDIEISILFSSIIVAWPQGNP